MFVLTERQSSQWISEHVSNNRAAFDQQGSFRIGVDTLPASKVVGTAALCIRWCLGVNEGLQRATSVLVRITETGIWTSSEHPPTFRRWRQALGASNDTPFAAGYLFEFDEIDDAVGCVVLALTFGWGFVAASDVEGRMVGIDHDGAVELQGGASAAVKEALAALRARR